MRALKVLILEDNAFQLMALHQMLNATGVFDVLTAESVEAARQSLANRGSIDIAICDLQLDGGDGLELIRYLAEGQVAQALIILSSAEQEVLDGAAHIARQQGLHVLGCLQKPASAAVLGQLLGAYQQRFGRQRPGLPLAQVCELLSLHELQAAAGPRAIEKYCVAYFQPRITREGGLLGVEALARWQHPEQGMLLPGSFVPVLEYAGLGNALGWHMLEQALQLSAEVGLAREEPLPIAVNVPGELVEQADFAVRLGELLARFQLPAGLLTLEVLDNSESATAVALIEGLLRLRMLGCQLAIGDFGLAGAGFQRLLDLPFSLLTVAPSLVSGLALDSRKRALLAGILRMAEGMGMRVVVSGIATGQDQQAVDSLGEMIIQGDHIAAPMSRLEVLDWLAQGRFGQPLAPQRQVG